MGPDAEVDVVIAGSGAAGMTAALTAAHLGLSALVIEKAASFGGSTARSGGGIWAPGNAVLRGAGVADSAGQARDYLAYVAPGVPAASREALLEAGPAMLDLVLAMTPVRFAWVPGYADYYPEAPGGRATRGGEPVLIRARRGVLLATGGFERNEEMRRRYQREPIGTGWTTGAPGNTGDGIRAGMDLGADTALMDDAWWGPSIALPGG